VSVRIAFIKPLSPSAAIRPPKGDDWLHELATNAAKYGALSNGTGKVQITWQSLKERKMKLYWRETGGPHVTPPETKGFGSLLIDQSFSDDGESCFVFRPEGLICSLTISV
jgi:two-component sensor histidine kinase